MATLYIVMYMLMDLCAVSGRVMHAFVEGKEQLIQRGASFVSESFQKSARQLCGPIQIAATYFLVLTFCSFILDFGFEVYIFLFVPPHLFYNVVALGIDEPLCASKSLKQSQLHLKEAFK